MTAGIGVIAIPQKGSLIDDPSMAIKIAKETITEFGNILAILTTIKIDIISKE